ncbi:ALKBH3 [Symbiodinium pilosum]|uniref:ALKBH3 protein n=1 Tax=Symbiodinium pilosum TaxID=2952 RepID=A0A812QWB6_SYMPI|nr:ALKBH3 [Symbiodinium pilosum]
MAAPVENWYPQQSAVTFQPDWQHRQFDAQFLGRPQAVVPQAQCQLQYHACTVQPIAFHPMTMEFLHPLQALALQQPYGFVNDMSGMQQQLLLPRPAPAPIQLQEALDDGETSSSDGAGDVPPDGPRRRRRRRGKRKRGPSLAMTAQAQAVEEDFRKQRAFQVRIYVVEEGCSGGDLLALAQRFNSLSIIGHFLRPRRRYRSALSGEEASSGRFLCTAEVGPAPRPELAGLDGGSVYMCWNFKVLHDVHRLLAIQAAALEVQLHHAAIDFAMRKDQELCEALLPRSASWLTLPGCQCEYEYAGLRFPAMTMPEWFLEITDEVARACGLQERPNSCNANLYKSGVDNVSWHCDDEPLFDATGRDALIVSLSLGATRSFCLRPKDDPFQETLLHLEDGDLCTMEGLCQKHYRHRVPPEEDVSALLVHKLFIHALKAYNLFRLLGVWALDTAEAFEQLNFKAAQMMFLFFSTAIVSTAASLAIAAAPVLVPHPVEDSEDLLWSLVEWLAEDGFWTNMHAPPGRAFAVEGMNRLGAVQEWLPKLYATLGIVGSVDLYCSRVGRRPVNSYCWHADTVDALIYVLNGTKRVRVAGHFPGSRVTLDKVISAGSVVYVPGGRFHSLRSMPMDVDASKAELVVALSIGLPNPNEDLLEARIDLMRKAFENQNLQWNDVVGHVAALPEDFPKKPEVVFAEKDDLDSHGFSALHRRTLQGDARRLAVLLHSGAEVNLRSLPSAQRPALTALGLAACCVAEEPALLLTGKLLDTWPQKSIPARS